VSATIDQSRRRRNFPESERSDIPVDPANPMARIELPHEIQDDFDLSSITS
jgi:hypothetical protein